MSLKTFSLIAIGLVFSGNAFALECAGTEPFWSAALSPEQLVLEVIGDQKQTTALTGVRGAAGVSSEYLQIYSDQRGPVAVVQKIACSDGMSEIEYPSQITLFTGSYTLFGCCR